MSASVHRDGWFVYRGETAKAVSCELIGFDINAVSRVVHHSSQCLTGSPDYNAAAILSLAHNNIMTLLSKHLKRYTQAHIEASC